MNFHLFSAETYNQRRNTLADHIKSGLIWILGNGEAPKNYLDNTYHFRQDSNFLYFGGIDLPDLSLLMDLDEGKTYLCGDDRSIDLVVWMGPQPSLKDLAARVGIESILTTTQVKDKLGIATRKKQKVHYLPPYRGFSQIKISEWLHRDVRQVNNDASEQLIKAVIAQRSIKEEQELSQMEIALSITHDMHLEVIYETRAGLKESEVLAHLMSVVHKNDVDLAYPVILTINGQTLHNHNHSNQMKDGQLLLGDFGAESVMHYAGDITRTIPVNGKFTGLQKDIYEIVLAGQKAAIDLLKPGMSYKEIHLAAARKMAEGLMALGLMRGNVDDAVQQGAHAMFFPHGLGHMIGLDVHDMEDLGEDWVGYDGLTKRSEQFGLRSLRYGKQLIPGIVLTVEPGIYFIPELMDIWSAEKKHVEFINYPALAEFRNFGGIRIEDNYVITDDGKRLLGPPIPKEVSDIEFLMSTNRTDF
jgi:Xaa-Pro aminopeptidase